jgi:hypothetical protein
VDDAVLGLGVTWPAGGLAKLAGTTHGGLTVGRSAGYLPSVGHGMELREREMAIMYVEAVQLIFVIVQKFVMLDGYALSLMRGFKVNWLGCFIGSWRFFGSLMWFQRWYQWRHVHRR